MCGRFLLCFHLLMAVIMSVFTLANSEEEIDHEIECEGSQMKLHCLKNSYVILIVSAIYGRSLTGSVLCSSPSSSAGSDEIFCERDVAERVKTVCEGKSNCSFILNGETLGEPCPTVYKYLDVGYKCDDSSRYVREQEKVIRPRSPTPSFLPMRYTTTYSLREARATTAINIQPTPSLVANIQELRTTHLTEEVSRTRSSALSSSRPHSVSVTTVSRAQRLTTTSVTTTISHPSSTTKSTSKTNKNKTINDGQERGTMKLFRFILSFHIVHEESIKNHTATSVVWFLFGILAGLFIMIAVLVYYRLRQSRRSKPKNAAYLKQKDSMDERVEERLMLHSKELETLEMESQFGETV